MGYCEKHDQEYGGRRGACLICILDESEELRGRTLRAEAKMVKAVARAEALERELETERARADKVEGRMAGVRELAGDYRLAAWAYVNAWEQHERGRQVENAATLKVRFLDLHVRLKADLDSDVEVVRAAAYYTDHPCLTVSPLDDGKWCDEGDTLLLVKVPK